MTDVASLGFAIDSSEARRAKADLDALKATSSDASEQALRLTRAFIDGRDPLSAYRAELALMDQQLRQAGQGIDGLIDKMNRLTVGMTSLAGPARELRQVVGQVEAAAVAFNTSAGAMESFVRTSRNLGLSSQEMTSSLQRIQLALQGVTEEGQRARQVLANYGVAVEGRAPGSEQAILREFTQAMRRYGMDASTGGDIQSVLGPMSISSIAALRDPDYRTMAQRSRETRNDAEASRISETRRQLVARRRGNEQWYAELTDLENEYGVPGAVDGATSFFQTPASRRAALEARRDGGQMSRSDFAQTNAFLFDPLRYSSAGMFGPGIAGAQSGLRILDRAQTWLGSPEYLQNRELISTLGTEDRRTSGWGGWVGSFFTEAGRNVQNAAGIWTPPAMQGLPLNERVGGIYMGAQREDFLSGMTGPEREQQLRMIGYMGEMGVSLPGAPGMRPEDIRGRFTAGQQTAVDVAEGAFYRRGLRDRFTNIASQARVDNIAFTGVDGRMAREYGIEPTRSSGGLGVENQEIERNRRVAEVIVRAEDEIKDAMQRRLRVQLEVAEIDRRMEEQRTQNTRSIARETAALREQIQTISDQLGVGDSMGAEAQLAVNAAQRRQRSGGGDAVESLEGGVYSAARNTSGTILRARRQNETLSYRAGRLQTQDSESDISISERVFDATREQEVALRALGEAAGQNNEKYRQAEVLLREQRETLRAQLEIEKQITREIAEQNGIRRTENLNFQTQQMQGDRTQGQRTERERLQALAAARMQGATPEQVRDRLENDPAFASDVRAEYAAERRNAAEAGRFRFEDDRAAARVGGTGNPVLDRRQRYEEERARITRNLSGVDRDRALSTLEDRFNTETAGILRSPIVGNQQAAEEAAARLRGMGGGAGGYSMDDVRRLAQTIGTEASTFSGRQAAGNVVLNRARMTGQRVGDVVTAPGQFEPWQNGRAQRFDLSTPDGREALRVAEMLLSGQLPDITGGADHFYSPASQRALGREAPDWARGRTPTASVGGNQYYRVGSVPRGDYRAAYGIQGDLAAAGARYRNQTGAGDSSEYELSQALAAAAQSLNEFTQSAAQARIALADMADEAGQTPYERGLARVRAEVRPAAERDQSIADTLRASGRTAEADDVERRVGQRYAQAESLYQGRLGVQRGDERQRRQEELDDGNFLSRYIFSPTMGQRDLAMRQERRRQRNTFGSVNESDVEQVGAAADLREQQRTLSLISDSWYMVGNSASQALERIILQGGKATDVLKAMLAEMASFSLRAGGRLLMQGVGGVLQTGFNSLFPGAEGGAALGAGFTPASVSFGAGGYVGAGPFLSAQGRVFDDRAYALPMAQGGGGVFSHAQYLPMANGGTALVGEAGPEAAVPLVRMPSGNLGVRSGGGGGPAITNSFNVTVNGGGGGGGQGGGQKIGADVARALEGMVAGVLARQISPGGMLHGSAGGSQPTMR